MSPDFASFTGAATSAGASALIASTRDEELCCLRVKTAMVRHKTKKSVAKIAVMRAKGFFEERADKILESVSAAPLVNEFASGLCRKIQMAIKMVTTISRIVNVSIIILTIIPTCSKGSKRGNLS